MKDAHLVWMAWQSQGHDIPIDVVNTMQQIDQWVGDSDTWITEDGKLYGRATDPREDKACWPAVIDHQPCELPAVAVECLKRFVLDALARKTWRHEPFIRTTLDTPAVHAWLGAS